VIEDPRKGLEMKERFEIDVDGREIASGITITAVVKIEKTLWLKIGLWIVMIGARIGGFGFQVEDEPEDGVTKMPAEGFEHVNLPPTKGLHSSYKDPRERCG